MERGNTKRDMAVSLTKGVIGALPYVGPLVAEVVGTLIPNQRLERIEDFLKILEEKIVAAEKEKIQARFKSEEFIDLFEDSIQQAARALSDERKQYLASLVKNSLTSEKIKYIKMKRLLSLLNNLNDFEILYLSYKSLSVREGHEFYAKHKELFTVPSPHTMSPDEEFEKLAIYESHENNLLNLGLLKPDMKASMLGRMLLQVIDLEK